MKTIQNIKRALVAMTLVSSLFVWVGCNDTPPSEFYYTFKGETVASYLQHDSRYSQFVSILDRAKMMDLLSTYGEYTCLAVPNYAIDSLLHKRNKSTVQELSDLECDTLARTHLLKGAFYTTDLTDGALPNTNFMDRYLTYSSDSIRRSGVLSFGYFINKSAEIIIKNDSVVNGVVHTLNKVVEPSNRFLPQLMQRDTSISIFTEAMFLTGIQNKMDLYIDPTYSVGADSTDLKLGFVSGNRNRQADFPAKRKFGFTGFVEKNSVYRKYGIHSGRELVKRVVEDRAFDLYDPNGRIKYDSIYTDSANALYRYVAYHFIGCIGNYDSWTCRPITMERAARYEVLDPQDFFEAMCPGSIIKFQKSGTSDVTDPKNLLPVQLWMNRRRNNEGALAIRTATVDDEPINPYGVDKAVRGVRVYTATEAAGIDQNALNGVYHYIDDLLVFDNKTVKDALNTRMRMDACTLSPDFMNNVGRGRVAPTTGREAWLVVTRYKRGFITNFSISPTTNLGVRNDSGAGWSPSYQADAVDFKGQYDYTVRIPHVPQGQYDVRLGMNIGGLGAVVQFYFDGKATGIPLDIRLYKGQPEIGYTEDTGNLEEDLRVDKDMKSRGFMKGTAAWYLGDDHVNTMRTTRGNGVRIVIANAMFREGEEHSFRVKNVLENQTGEILLDYLELCPKSVYDSPEGEDWY